MRRTIENLLIGTVIALALVFIIQCEWLHMVILIIFVLLSVIIIGEITRSVIADFIDLLNKKE